MSLEQENRKLSLDSSAATMVAKLLGQTVVRVTLRLIWPLVS